MREPGGVHSDILGRRSLSCNESVHAMEELGVQSLHSLLQDGIAGSSCKTESLEEKWVEGELRHEGPVAESRIELESKEDKESGKREVRRSSEGGGPVRYHIAKLDKFIKQELNVTRSGCVV